MKICFTCGCEYSTSVCKPCKKAYLADYYKKNKARLVANMKVYRAENSAELNARALEYHYANRQERISKMREYSVQNRDHLKDKAAEYYKVNSEKIKLRVAKYKRDNPDKVAEFRKNETPNPECKRRNKHIRRAREFGNNDIPSKNIEQLLYTLQKGLCACCGKSLDAGYHVDHIIPLALGGRNIDGNLQLLTPKCNLRKGAKHPLDVMANVIF